MVYPINVRSISLDHQGGTKSYHLYLIQNADGKAVVINRWGKTGQLGELKAETYDNVPNAERAFEKKESEKSRKGYRHVGVPKNASAANPGELARQIGIPIFNKMGAKAVNHLDPGYDTSKMRDAEPNRLNEDGRLTGDDAPRKADLSEDLAEMRKQEAAESAAAYADNDLYGRF